MQTYYSNVFFFQRDLSTSFVLRRSELSLTKFNHIKRKCNPFSLNNLFFFLKNAVCRAHTGNKERNIVFQKWRGKHYRKWTWSVGFQRKKYCSKCANIHFHLGEKPFQRKLSIDKEKLPKMCQHSFSPFQRKLSIDKELHQL